MGGEENDLSILRKPDIQVQMEAAEDIPKAAENAPKAMRFNAGKPQFSLIDLNCLEPMAHVLEFGAKKYDRDNWKGGFHFSKVIDSMMRHIAGLERGEWLDPESGLPHIGHIQCNAMFMGLMNNYMDISTLKQKYEEWKTQNTQQLPYTT